MGLLEQLLRYLEDLTARRFFTLLIVMSLLIGAALFYERYTANFALARLEKASLLLKELESSKYEASSSKELAEMHHEMSLQLHALLVKEREKAQTAEVKSEFPIPEHVLFWKMLAGGAIWLILGIAMLLFSPGKDAKLSGSFGFLILAASFALLGGLLPTIYWPWFNLFIYPLLSAGLIILPAILIPAFKKVRDTSREKAILNNLRQISAAADQYFLENGVAEVELAQLIGPEKYIRNIVSVAGEKYDGMKIQQGQEIYVVTKEGKRIGYNP
jgi:hypothetical protein